MRAVILAIAPVAVLLVALAGVKWWLVGAVGVLVGSDVPLYLAAEGVCWVLFAAAVVLLPRVPPRAVAPLVLAGSLLIGAAAATGPPNISTDSARYGWDGIVQDAGVSPYRYVPADPALTALRPEWLFPAPRADGTCPGVRAAPTAEVGTGRTICTVINRPQVPTIYPPVAEALFALARLPVPRTVQYLPLQLLGILAVLATSTLLLALLRKPARWRAAVLAWCPFVATEAVTNAHVDVWAALLAVAATALAVKGRTVRAGILLGLAVATKFLPVLVALPLLRRRPVALAAAAAGAVAAVYLPHVLAVGPSVVGYLTGYLKEEGYDSGSRSALLSWVLPPPAATPAAALLVAALAVLLLIRGDPADPWAAQTILVGSALALTSPAYAWYGLLLLPFVVMSGRWEWLTVLLSLSILSLQFDRLAFRAVLVTAVAVVVTATVVRSRLARRTSSSAATLSA